MNPKIHSQLETAPSQSRAERDDLLRAQVDTLVQRAKAAQSPNGNDAQRLHYIDALSAAEEMCNRDPELIRSIELSILEHSGYFMYCGKDVPADIKQRRASFRLGLKHGWHDRVELALHGLLCLYGREGTLAAEIVVLYRECVDAYDRESVISENSVRYLELLADWSMRMNEFELATHLYERLVTAQETLTSSWEELAHHPWRQFIVPSLRLRQVEANLRWFAIAAEPGALNCARNIIEKVLVYMENGYMDDWDRTFAWMSARIWPSILSKANELRKSRRQADNLRSVMDALGIEPRVEEAKRALLKVIKSFASNNYTCYYRRMLSQYNTDGRWHMARGDQKHLAPPPYSFDDELTDLVTGNHETRRMDRKAGEDRIATKLNSAFVWIKDIDRGFRHGNSFYWAQLAVDEAMEICHARMFGACLVAAWLASEHRSHKDIARAEELLEEARRHKKLSGDSWKEQQNKAFSLVVRRLQRNKRLATEYGSYAPLHVY